MTQATKTTEEETTVNVKKMTCDELRHAIENLRLGKDYNETEKAYLKACEKELMKRWGIKG